MPHFLSSLRARLLFVVLLVALFPFSFSLRELIEQHQKAEQEAVKAAQHLAQGIAREHERLIESGRQLLVGLTQIPQILAHDSVGCSNLFSNLLKSYQSFTNIGAMNPNGDLICSALPFSEPVNVADRPYFKRALETKDFTVSEYLIGHVSGKAALTLTHPSLNSRGQVRAVFFLGLDLAWMNRALTGTRLPDGARVVITDRSGLILNRHPDPEGWIGRSAGNEPIVKTVLARREGTTEATGLDGMKRLYYFTAIRGIPGVESVFVWVSIPKDVVLAEGRRQAAWHLAQLGIIVLLALTLAWTGTDIFVIRRVNALVKATKELATGDLRARTGLPHKEDELGRLASSFDQMAESLERTITKRKQTEEALRESEMRFRSVTQSANDAIISADGSGTIISWNKGAQTIFGYAEEEVLHEPLATLMPERYRDAHRAGLERLRSTGKSNVLGKAVELQGLRKDGSEFPLEISLSNWEIEGKTFFGGIIRDITERKRAEEEVRRNLERIQALREIDQAVASTLNLDAIFNVLLERVDTFLLYPAATMVRLFNQQTRELEFFTCRNLDKDEWKARDTSSQGGRAKVVFEAKEPLLVRNVQTDPRTWEPEFFRQHGLVSYLGVPLMAKGKPLGVLSLYTKQEHEFSKEEVDFLSTLAGQAAIAIQNSQLYEQTKKQAEELKKAIAEMEISNKVKDQFLSVMSHELRTPLNVVLGYTGMLRDGMLGEIAPEQKKVLGKVINRANDLLTMIRDVLHATQIESRSVIVELQLVNLLDFLDKLRAGYDPSLDKEVNFVWDYPGDLPPVVTDSEKLKLILQNLIHNAVKFTEKGHVKISARVIESSRQKAERSREEAEILPTAHRLLPTSGQWLEFKVVDSGIGISKEFLPVIFKKFTQADSTETRLYGGVGLGLYIVKEFTEMLGGTVRVESEPGKGSTFTVTLPLEQ